MNRHCEIQGNETVTVDNGILCFLEEFVEVKNKQMKKVATVQYIDL